MHESETINEVKTDLVRLGNQAVAHFLHNDGKGYLEIIDDMSAEGLNPLC